MADAVPHAGGRYGIWGINPYGPTINTKPAIHTAIDTATGINGLFAKQYATQLEKAKADLASRTLESEVGAKNTMNAANQRFYPMQEEAKTRQEQEKIKEIVGRTGLTYAQAKHALASAGAESARGALYGTQNEMARNPMFEMDAMIREWKAAPNGSPQKAYLAYTLKNKMAEVGAGSSMTPPMVAPGAAQGKGKGKSSSNQLGFNGALPGLGSPWGKDPRMGSTRSGAGGTYTDPQTGQIVSTNTNAQASRDQKAIAGTENMKQYVGELAKTLPQFQRMGKRGSTALQGFSNAFLGSNYGAPSELASGEAALLEQAEGFVNTFQLNSTEENIKKGVDIMRPRFGESPKGYEDRVQKQLDDFKTQEQRAEARLAGGTPVGQSPPQAPQGPDYFVSNSGLQGTPWEMQQQAAQPAPVQMPPSFNSKEEGVAWFNAQPPEVQAQIRAQLGGGQ